MPQKCFDKIGGHLEATLNQPIVSARTWTQFYHTPFLGYLIGVRGLNNNLGTESWQ